jgi:hypothetical protein
MKKYEIIPNKSVGEFKLNDDISIYLKKYDFEYLRFDDIIVSEMYLLEDEGITLSVEDNKIDSISCEKNCYLNGKNIIGMNINEFIKLIDAKPDEIETLYVTDTDTQDVYDFEDLGFQVWCDKDTIVEIVVITYEDEE